MTYGENVNEQRGSEEEEDAEALVPAEDKQGSEFAVMGSSIRKVQRPYAFLSSIRPSIKFCFRFNGSGREIPRGGSMQGVAEAMRSVRFTAPSPERAQEGNEGAEQVSCRPKQKSHPSR